MPIPPIPDKLKGKTEFDKNAKHVDPQPPCSTQTKVAAQIETEKSPAEPPLKKKKRPVHPAVKNAFENCPATMVKKYQKSALKVCYHSF